jgi:hypothetical protein
MHHIGIEKEAYFFACYMFSKYRGAPKIYTFRSKKYVLK